MFYITLLYYKTFGFGFHLNDLWWRDEMMLPTKQKSILVLDDDPDIGSIFRLGLQRKFGSDVFAFTDPFLALEHFKINSERYGLVISDVRMPVMNGYEFVTKVKQINPDVKVWLMSAFEVSDLELDFLTL